MKVRLDFVPGPVPEERDAVELELFPLERHGCRMELVDAEGPSGWPVITVEGPEDVVRGLLRRAGVEWETVEVLHEVSLRSAVGRRALTFWSACTCGAEGPTQTSAGLAHGWGDEHREETARAALEAQGVVAFCVETPGCRLVAGHYGRCSGRLSERPPSAQRLPPLGHHGTEASVIQSWTTRGDDPGETKGQAMTHETTYHGPRFADVEVELTGQDGNAFGILGKVCRALKAAGHGDAVDEFMAEATDGDYDHLLQTVMAYVEVK